MEPLYCDRQMGRKGVISSHATLYSRRECKRPTQIAARSAAPISRETPPPYLEPCANELFWVLVDRFIKGVAERRFTKHTCGSLHFLALRFIKKKFGTQMEIDSGTFSFFWGLGGPSEPIKSHWNILLDIVTHWRPLELEERYFIHASSSNIGAIWKKSGLWDSLLRNNTPR